VQKPPVRLRSMFGRPPRLPGIAGIFSPLVPLLLTLAPLPCVDADAHARPPRAERVTDRIAERRYARMSIAEARVARAEARVAEIAPVVPVPPPPRPATLRRMARAGVPLGGPTPPPVVATRPPGARPPLIAFNVYLGSDDVEVAKAIARAVRHSSGGLRYVKALGLLVKGRAQVSMNLTDYRQTPVHRAVEMIRREAERYGVPVVESEIIGLIPNEALVEAAEFYLQLGNFSPDQILENRLADLIQQE